MNNHDGIMLWFSSNTTISGNNITANNEYGIWLGFWSENNSISGNNITDSGYGISLFYDSYYNSINGNNVANNDYGIWLEFFSSYNNISGNSIAGNEYGIWLRVACNYNNINRNNIADNAIGIWLGESNHNMIYHNNFIGNVQQVYDFAWDIPELPPSMNIWDDGYPSGGNYWSDYTSRYPDAQELDGSGIWDTPYVIDEINQDNYPLMEPWTPVEAPPVEDTEAYVVYVNGTIQELPYEIFNRPEEDVPGIKNDFSDLLDDALENIKEGNYEGAIDKLNRIKDKIFEEMVESADRERILSLVDDLIAYLETLS